MHFGIKSKHTNTRTINDITTAIDIQTTLLVVKNFFFPSVPDPSAADGPCARFPGACPEGGTHPEGSVPEGGGACGGNNGDVGGGSGVIVELNGFPSFLVEN